MSNTNLAVRDNATPPIQIARHATNATPKPYPI